MLTRMGLPAPWNLDENDTFAKSRPLVLSRHTRAVKRLEKGWRNAPTSEHECGRRTTTRQERGRIAGRTADVEHAVFRFHRRGLDQFCQHHGLEQMTHLLAGGRPYRGNVGVEISKIGVGFGHEALARKLEHCCDNALIGD